MSSTDMEPTEQVREYARAMPREGKKMDDLTSALVTKVSIDDAANKKRQDLPFDWQDLFKLEPRTVQTGQSVHGLQELDDTSRKLAAKWLKVQSKLPKEQRSKIEDTPSIKELFTAVDDAMKAKKTVRHGTKLGRVKQGFTRVCQSLETHKTLFSLIPSGDKYFSLLTGSLTVIVKASVMHSDISSKIEDILERLSDIVVVWARQKALHGLNQSAAPLAAKLYTVVFTFLLEVIDEWLLSTKSRVLHSLGNGFDTKLRVAQSKIESLSSLLVWHAQLDNSERIKQIPTTETWMKVMFPMLQDLLLKTIAPPAIDQLVAQCKKTEHQSSLLITPSVPAGPTRVAIKSVGDANADPTEIEPVEYRKSDILSAFASVRYLYRETEASQLHQDPSQIQAGLETSAKLLDWYGFPDSSILWLNGPFQQPQPSHVAMIASAMNDVVNQAHLASIFHYCQRAVGTEGDATAEAILAKTVYSLIEQAVSLLPDTFESAIDLGQNRLVALDGTIGSMDLALDLLADLLQLGPGVLFVILAGVDCMDTDRELRPHLTRLVDILSRPVVQEESGQAIILKTLLTTDGYIDTLDNIDPNDRLDLQGTTNGDPYHFLYEGGSLAVIPT
ncbi:Hypothetical protein D9617_4g002670 [Elsinoe fawcettii]|nr:Hypothetical protein D9617_4g002670 [Elsinoe fawcettii]